MSKSAFLWFFLFFFYVSQADKPILPLLYITPEMHFKKDNKAINLRPLNTIYDEYQPTLTLDEQVILFASTRSGGMGSEDFWYAKREGDSWGKPVNFQEVNTPSVDAAACISPDGKAVYHVRDENKGTLCDIYVSIIEEGKWQTPVRLPNTINTHYWESQPSISADGNMLFFVSNRPGGMGMHDIYWSRRDPVTGEWLPAENLGKNINTSESEFSPFIHPDGKTLYFSSNGRVDCYGGYDIYKSVYENGVWSPAINIGTVFNSEEDDKYFVLSPNGEYAYFSSNREGSLGGQDLWMIKAPKEEKKPYVTLTGVVKDALTDKVLDATLTITDHSAGKVIAVVHTNNIIGKYAAVVQAGGIYGITISKEGYAFYSEYVTIPAEHVFKEFVRDIKLERAVRGTKMIMNNIFFESGKATLNIQSSKVELDKLVKLLKENPHIKVIITGHTDNVGQPEKNKILSEQRANSVKEYLIKQGISESVITTKGMGDAHPIADNLTEEGRRKNRRIEIEITE
ncbi:MAG: OmpA family protein [Bacteroidia bacterium]|nr:OmpA family protein [Bacteroidia bacterium]MDW8302472.1 OmpA family protein [Bacteroidia bacterium]